MQLDEFCKQLADSTQDQKVWAEVIAIHGDALQYVTDPSDKLIATALKANGRAIRHVKKICWEYIDIAVRSNGMALEYIKEDWQIFDISLAAVMNTWHALQFCKFRDWQKYPAGEEICFEALRQNGHALRYIIDPSEEMRILGVQSQKSAILLLTPEQQTLNVCKAALRASSSSFKYFNNPVYEVMELAIKLDWNNIRYIPPKNITKELCRLAFIQDSDAKFDFPDNMLKYFE